MEKLTYKDLLEAGVHFGHLSRKWDPRMAPFIFMEKSGIHIIDLHKTLVCLEEASNAVKSIVRSGRKVLFVATKKQAKSIVEEEAKRLKMPYVTERWLGGMLTNFITIKKSIDRLNTLTKMFADDSIKAFPKKEMTQMQKEMDKLESVLGGIKNMKSYPAAVFIVDPNREHIAVKEAKKLRVPLVAIVDTNCDPDDIDFIIPSSDLPEFERALKNNPSGFKVHR